MCIIKEFAVKKFTRIITGGLLVSAVLLGCQKEDTETKKQLAQMQAELEEQKRLNTQMQAQILKEQDDKEQKQAEQEQEALQQDIEQKAGAKQGETAKPQTTQRTASDTAQKESAQSAQAAPPPKPQTKKITEKLVRYPATVVTTSGYGQLSLRGEPSTKGIEVGVLDDGDEVFVTARTNKCEVIGKVEGCWVKVDIHGIKGYMFDGYLNREVLSQSEKESLYGSHDERDEYTY